MFVTGSRWLCVAAVLLCCCLKPIAPARADAPVKVKVFVAAMFEIGANTGDRAGEFQHWYERYWMQSGPTLVRGALNPVYCDADAVCGSVLGMGKVSSSASMQAILLDPRFDFSQTYFIVSGVAGTPPARGTIGSVNWATWLVDYDLGHRWAPEEGEPGEPTFMPRKGYEAVRTFRLNPSLVAWAVHLSLRATDSMASESTLRRRLADWTGTGVLRHVAFHASRHAAWAARPGA